MRRWVAASTTSSGMSGPLGAVLGEPVAACEARDFNVEMSGSLRPLLLLLPPVGEVTGTALVRLFIVCGVLGQAPVRRRGVPSIVCCYERGIIGGLKEKQIFKERMRRRMRRLCCVCKVK